MRKVFLVVLIMWVISVTFAYAESITVTWDANSEEDLAGYKVYYGTSAGNYLSPVNVGNVTVYEITGLTADTRYYIALTAYDTSQNESEKSDEVNAVAHPLDNEAPPIPFNFRRIAKAFMLLEVA